MIIATLTVTMNEQGRVNVDGPLSQQAQCYAMLELAKDVVRAYNPQPTMGIDAPGVTLEAAPGEDINLVNQDIRADEAEAPADAILNAENG